MKSKNTILAGLGAVVLMALTWAALSRHELQSGAANSTAAPAPVAVAPPAPQPPPVAQPSPPAPAQEPSPAPPAGMRVPHFHKTLAEAGPLPRVLAAEQFAIPVVARAYRAAARIPTVLAVQPCYCYCDKMGHGSLLDCFATDHGAG
jgi:hypothetical protein